MAIHHYIILLGCVPGKLEEFERWYDNEHLRDVVAVPGVKSAKRYRLNTSLDGDYNEQAPPWNSLSIYELDTEDPVALARHIKSLAGTAAMPVSDTADRTKMIKILGEFTREVKV